MLKAFKILAQGNALGRKCFINISPVGAEYNYIKPFQGLFFYLYLPRALPWAKYV